MLPILRSKNFPTYPWNIPQTPNQQFMLWEFLQHLVFFFWMPGVCDPGVCWSSLRSEKPSMTRWLQNRWAPKTSYEWSEMGPLSMAENI